VVCGGREGRRPSHREPRSAGAAHRPRERGACTAKGGWLGRFAAEDVQKSCTITKWVPTVSEVDTPPSRAEEGGWQEVS
jgi:hypothetical protein